MLWKEGGISPPPPLPNTAAVGDDGNREEDGSDDVWAEGERVR